PSERFELAEVAQARVDEKARVKVKQARYSVPASLAGRTVRVRIFPLTVEVFHRGRLGPTSGAPNRWCWTTTLRCYGTSRGRSPGRFLCTRPASAGSSRPPTTGCGRSSRKGTGTSKAPGP